MDLTWSDLEEYEEEYLSGDEDEFLLETSTLTLSPRPEMDGEPSQKQARLELEQPTWESYYRQRNGLIPPVEACREAPGIYFNLQYVPIRNIPEGGANAYHFFPKPSKKDRMTPGALAYCKVQGCSYFYSAGSSSSSMEVHIIAEHNDILKAIDNFKREQARVAIEERSPQQTITASFKRAGTITLTAA